MRNAPALYPVPCQAGVAPFYPRGTRTDPRLRSWEGLEVGFQASLCPARARALSTPPPCLLLSMGPARVKVRIKLHISQDSRKRPHPKCLNVAEWSGWAAGWKYPLADNKWIHRASSVLKGQVKGQRARLQCQVHRFPALQLSENSWPEFPCI